MRTKTLLLTAVLSAAGLASSFSLAQGAVYSVNAVGYVNLTVPAGLSLIANPLDATDNTIANVLKVPAGTQIYKFNGTGFTSALYDDIDGWTSSGQPAGNITLNPGEGMFVRNNSGPFTNTFVGEVKQGNLSTPLPAGLSIVASQVPQQGKVSTDLSFPLIAGTQIYSSMAPHINHFYMMILTVGRPVVPRLNRALPSQKASGCAITVLLPAGLAHSQ